MPNFLLLLILPPASAGYFRPPPASGDSGSTPHPHNSHPHFPHTHFQTLLDLLVPFLLGEAQAAATFLMLYKRDEAVQGGGEAAKKVCI